MNSNQHQYVEGQLLPSQALLLEQFAAESERAVLIGNPELDVPYGPHPRQTLDLFRTSGKRMAVVAYFHAGYWQSRDKSQFRFLAPPLTTAGFDVAIVNYPLSPETPIGAIALSAAASLTRLAQLSSGSPMILVGHSAGAHIAVELASRHPNIAGILAISGVYDLVPLIDTSLNRNLALDSASASQASPLHRVAFGSPPAVFAVGALETSAFRDQSSAMAASWIAAGNEAQQITIAGADHFSILGELCRDDGVLRGALREFGYVGF